MPANSKETAEQKLLKMIEVSSHPDTVSPSRMQQKTAKKQNVLSVVKFVNLSLIGIVVLLVCLILYDVKTGAELLSRPMDFSAEQNVKQNAKVQNAIPTVQRISYYLASVEKRNFFQPYEAAQTASKTADNTHLSQMSSKLKLVGVSWLDTVESASVLIEDTDKKKTYYLRKGKR